MSSTDGTGAPGPMKCWTVCHNFARNWPCLWERDGACRRSYTSKRAVFLYLHTHTQKLSMCTVYIYNHIYIYYTNICTYIYIYYVDIQSLHNMIHYIGFRSALGKVSLQSRFRVSGFGFRWSKPTLQTSLRITSRDVTVLHCLFAHRFLRRLSAQRSPQPSEHPYLEVA